jgi:ABC-type multidrug transport system ATPase subunit
MAKRRRPPPERQPLALVARGLTKSYGDLVALAPLDIEIAPGGVVALMGHNGSGKSTLLQLAAGLLDPTAGAVTIRGRAAGSLEARRAVGYVGDSPVLYDDLSVWEHLEYLAGVRGVPDWEDRGRTLLDRLGLADRWDDLPGGFSRGLRQKTALAIGFVWDAPVVLVDEPFVGLDAAGKEALLEIVGERRRAGATLLIATHDEGILDDADRCIVLGAGELLFDGKPGELPVTEART